jgi:hypothetical protein
MRFDGMPQWRIGANPVMVATPDAFPDERSSVRELPKNPLNRPFCDAHFPGYLAHANILIGRYGNQHKRVITEKRPSVSVRMWFHNT